MRGFLAQLTVVLAVFAAMDAQAAGDAYEPTDDHFQTMYDCLEASRQSTVAEIESGCVGIVANPCLEKPDNQSTHGMAGCAQREARIWDALLNDWYGSARDALPKSVRKDFRDAQRAWIKWRDAKCAFARNMFEGGTMGIPIAADCMMTTTARRALELRSLVVQFEQR